MKQDIYPLGIVLDTQAETDKFFGRYLEEILLTEGFPYIQRIDLKYISTIDPQRNPVLIFPQEEFNSNSAKNIYSYIHRGGTAFFMRPNKEMRKALAVKVEKSISNGYISWDTTQPIQFHGSADIYQEDQKISVIAYVKEEKDAAANYPGLFTLTSGKGTACIFSFNLAESILLTRQGNPLWTNSKGDASGSLRANDLFYRQSGEEMWIDRDNSDLPQADFLQRFFVDQIISFSSFPLPRVWYFPGMQKSSFTIVADSDGTTPEQTRVETDLINSHDGSYSIYLINKTLDAMDKDDYHYLLDNKNEAAIHPDYSQAGDTKKPDKEIIKELYGEMISRYRKKFGTTPFSLRNHSLFWSGWVDIPVLEEHYGISADVNYSYPIWFGQKKYGCSNIGYLTGSGQPQRFCDEQGKLIDVFQVEQHLEDEVLVPEKGLGLTGEETYVCLKDFIQKSESGNYSYVVACFHPITVVNNPEAYKAVDKIVSFCKETKVPVRSIKEVIDFANARRGVRFSSFILDDDSYAFTITGSEKLVDKQVTVLIPAQKVEGVRVGGESIDLPQEILAGNHYYWHTLQGASVQFVAKFKGGVNGCT